MLRGYKLLTITHRHVSLTDLKDYVIPYEDNAQLAKKLQELKNQFDLNELLYLATCNRVIYLIHNNHPLGEDFKEKFLAAIKCSRVVHSIHIHALEGYCTTTNWDEQPQLLQAAPVAAHKQFTFLENIEAVEHFFELASSVDSLVVGEREIIHQLREAYRQCNQWQLTGDGIRLLMRFAVECAKDVYANTRIGEKQVSIVSLAMQHLREENLPQHARILMIGAGQTNLLVSKFLYKMGFEDVAVFNRSIEKAAALAETFKKGQAYTIEELLHYQKGFDCLIVCTGSLHTIVQEQLYRQLLVGDTRHKLVIDLAVPNNVSRAITRNHAVRYVEVENLRLQAQANLAFREREIQKAKQRIEKHLNEFHNSYQARQIELALREVPVKIKEIKSYAINEVFQKELETLDSDTRQLVEKMMNFMEKKCISVHICSGKSIINL
ncbi:MAG: glutamyl-tRNA reductase [Saprospiraceae bacterium]|nr:glutamyl-tRNA reductase [Saprospiraceae bacterium]MBP7679757.1 glutamyl-tRNA reductase [Saprospiraceae bacterium]